MGLEPMSAISADTARLERAGALLEPVQGGVAGHARKMSAAGEHAGRAADAARAPELAEACRAAGDAAGGVNADTRLVIKEVREIAQDMAHRFRELGDIAR